MTDPTPPTPPEDAMQLDPASISVAFHPAKEMPEAERERLRNTYAAILAIVTEVHEIALSGTAMPDKSPEEIDAALHAAGQGFTATLTERLTAMPLDEVGRYLFLSDQAHEAICTLREMLRRVVAAKVTEALRGAAVIPGDPPSAN